MSEKVRYKVRGRSLIDMVNALKAKSLILSAHFQRKLVWREIHKIDFIKTILYGYPFPEIFIARGGIDVDKMTSISCVVDGQQRMNSISEFVSDKFSVDGRKYSELTSSEKEEFLTYEIPTIELDLDQNDREVIQIFKRLNRTFYSLSQIEKLSTEYASSYFMLIAKMLCGELIRFDEESETIDINSNVNVSPSLIETDPNISESFVTWANSVNISSILEFILSKDIFSTYEISRQVHLMYMLNLQAMFLSGIYGRNERVTEHLEGYTNGFEVQNDLVERINNTAQRVIEMGINSFWFSKSNSFSLLIGLDQKRSEWNKIDWMMLKEMLNGFSETPPAEYAIAAKEGVNNKKERLTRHAMLSDLIISSIR